VLRKILLSTGNIPVARKSNDHQALFRGTIEALSRGGAVALFPEGTSYTEPRIMQVKDGASWAALEYGKWVKENPDRASDKPLVIVPCAIVYTNKSKYRSNVRPFGVFIDQHSITQSCRMIGYYGVSRFHKSRLAHQLTF